MEPAEAVLKFLRSVGPRSEAEFYLERFRSVDPHAFATLVVDSATMAESADAVCLDLRFLAHLDLFPVVTLGLLETRRASAHAAELARRLQAVGVRTAGPFAADQADEIQHSAGTGQIPLVRLSAADHGDRVQQLGAMLTELQSRKLIFLRQQGGLRTQGERVSVVNLSTDTEALAGNPSLSEADRKLLSASRDLALERTRQQLVVSMTSPINLLHELFTIRGAGTLLRRGAVVTRHAGLTGVDHDAVFRTLQASFGRPARRGLLQRQFAHCYVADDYRGLALLCACPFGGYLDKFAVTALARGEGLGRDLWSAILNDYPALLWRARPDNPIAGWYEQQAEGRWRVQDWNVYMRGIAPGQAEGAIAFAISRTVDI